MVSTFLKTEKTKISVIVPIYNADKYLKKCIDSIINQTYKDIEIILVNDGSTDGSRDIINEYESKDNRIIAVHKENGGIGSAYEIAFEQMTGDYVSFVDSDDYISLEMYEILVEVIQNEKPDIVQFNIIKVDENGNEIGIEKFDNINYNNMEYFFKEYYTKRFHPSLGCRIFKRDILKDVRLLKQNIGIDELLITQAMINGNMLVSINKGFYYLFMRQLSVSRSILREETLMQGIGVHRLICEIIDKKNSRLTFYPAYKYVDYIIYSSCSMDWNKVSSIEGTTNLLKQEFNENFTKLKKSDLWEKINFTKKLKLCLFRLNPKIYIKLNHIFKKGKR